VLLVALAILQASQPHVLNVGPGQDYPRIEAAVEAAQPKDTIRVYPGKYDGTAVLITKQVAIRGVGGEKPIRIDGGSFDYSGVGSTPRAIFQVDPDASGTTIEGFELTGAHNRSFNGAGVRINCANDVTVKSCDIHGNDMGIMSNGKRDAEAGKNQSIEHCAIHENGNSGDPGYNHNLYLGGTSVEVAFCDIYGSLTGHNLKSRAHYNLVRHCYIHDSANRECDFVEAWDTERPNSNAVLIGNVIVKDPKCQGNGAVIHFGKEKGKRNGSIYLLNNTIVTRFVSGVIVIDSPDAAAHLFNNVIVNTEQAAPALVAVDAGAKLIAVTGGNNWISRGYDLSQTSLVGSLTGTSRAENPLKAQLIAGRALAQPIPYSYVDGNGNEVKPKLDWIYAGNGKWQGIKAPFFGAG
jgi:hypothetical protein